MVDPRLERDIGLAEAPAGKPILTAYKDTRNLWTIGRGHLLEPQEHDWTGYTITPEQEQTIFDADILTAEHFAQRLPEWATCDTDCRQNALIELCFNMRGRWLGFKDTRSAWQHRNWQGAHDGLLESLWAHEVQPNGLDAPGRATRIANYVLTGQYPTA